jgi:hypothetical protein
MKTKMTIKVETTQHGFALVVGNKSWLLDDEQQLAEAVVFRVAEGCESDVSKRRMRKLLSMLAYGDKRERSAVRRVMSRRNGGKGRNYDPTQSRRNEGPQEEVSIN